MLFSVSFGNAQNCDGIKPGLSSKSLRERRQVSVRKVELNTFDSMHRKKYHRRGKRLAIFHHYYKVFEGRELNPTHAQPFRSQRKNHAPEFVTGISQRCHDH